MKNTILVIVVIAVIAGGYHYYSQAKQPGPEGVYFRENSDAEYIELTSNGRFELYQGGRTYKGTYKISSESGDGRILTLTLGDGRSVPGTIYSNYIIDNEDLKWIKEEEKK